MKNKLFVVAGLMMACMGASAQNYFGVTAGYNLSNRSFDEEFQSDAVEYSYRSGFNAGIAYEHRFNASENKNYMFLDASFLYSLQGFHYKYDIGKEIFNAYEKGDYEVAPTGKEPVYDENVDIKYLKLPVSFGYNFQLGEKFGLAPKVFGILKTRVDMSHGSIGAKYVEFAFGAGANLNIGEKFQVGLGYDWDPSYRDMVDGNAHVNLTYYIFSK
ncbi:MAG: outer membrane beta-barrel protein [Bacteroidales bacterium]|nr:outer membrane beta-barrel protein [Candidatus Scybalocola fimicaballi]